MESAKCDVCESNDFDVVLMERFTEFSGQWYPVLTCVCKACGHVFMNPRMTGSELAQFYTEQKRESFQVARGEKVGLFKADMDFIMKVLGPGDGRKALEVGCYTGYMLKRLQKDNWTVEGIEPNLESSRQANQLLGKDLVQTCMLEEFVKNAVSPYDLIVMGSVLEHINSPTKTLLHVNSLLKVNGYLFIRVPDVEELHLDTIADVFPLEHPHMYSRNSLQMLLQKVGMMEIARTVHERFKRHIILIAQKQRHVDSPQPFTISNYHDTMQQLISDYTTFAETERLRINKLLKGLYSPKPQRVAIYGAGTHTEFLLRYTNISQADILFLLDSNPQKWGKKFMGFQIKNPTDVKFQSIDTVVISSRAFQDEIYQKIHTFEEHGISIVRLYDIQTSRYPKG